ncbi:MAG: hypothetical protein KKI02_07510, partial [Planctomycetes bacterium]|nr:hypothetical protein [Planctomycetota bacterium]
MSTNGFLRATRGCAVALCALTLSLGVAKADVPDVVFEIQAVSGQFGASFEVLAEWGDYDPATQTWTWTLSEAVEFWDGGTFLGSLDGFDAEIVA